MDDPPQIVWQALNVKQYLPEKLHVATAQQATLPALPIHDLSIVLSNLGLGGILTDH